VNVMTVSDYFGKFKGHPALSEYNESLAEHLCKAVNRLLARAHADGISVDINPKTGTIISGEQYGGWRPPECPIGAPNSAHKTGQAVDLYDPAGELDTWIMAHQYMLPECGLYLEHPAATRGWTHLQTRAVKSGSRVFYP